MMDIGAVYVMTLPIRQLLLWYADNLDMMKMVNICLICYSYSYIL